MYGISWDRGRSMKNFRFDTICSITEEPQELQRYNCCACVFIGRSTVISQHQLPPLPHHKRSVLLIVINRLWNDIYCTFYSGGVCVWIEQDFSNLPVWNNCEHIAIRNPNNAFWRYSGVEETNKIKCIALCLQTQIP